MGAARARRGQQGRMGTASFGSGSLRPVRPTARESRFETIFVCYFPMFRTRHSRVLDPAHASQALESPGKPAANTRQQ